MEVIEESDKYLGWVRLKGVCQSLNFKEISVEFGLNLFNELKRLSCASGSGARSRSCGKEEKNMHERHNHVNSKQILVSLSVLLEFFTSEP